MRRRIRLRGIEPDPRESAPPDPERSTPGDPEPRPDLHALIEVLPQYLRVVLKFVSLIAIDVCNVGQKARKTGTPVTIVGREVRSAVKGFSVGKQENSQRPPPAPVMICTAAI